MKATAAALARLRCKGVGHQEAHWLRAKDTIEDTRAPRAGLRGPFLGLPCASECTRSHGRQSSPLLRPAASRNAGHCLWPRRSGFAGMAAADGADAASDIRIGDRVRDKSGNRATVRYLGPVATSKSADAVYVGEPATARLRRAPPPLLPRR